jgi:hypothetical protein
MLQTLHTPLKLDCPYVGATANAVWRPIRQRPMRMCVLDREQRTATTKNNSVGGSIHVQRQDEMPFSCRHWEENANGRETHLDVINSHDSYRYSHHGGLHESLLGMQVV